KIEKALAGLEKRIAAGKLRDRFKMERNLGRIQASHPQVADLYEMAVKDSKEGPRLVWRQKPEQQQWLEAREGAYLLRTNLTADGAGRSLEEVYAADGSRSGVSHAEERTGHSPALPSAGTTCQGARAGGVS